MLQSFHEFSKIKSRSWLKDGVRCESHQGHDGFWAGLSRSPCRGWICNWVGRQERKARGTSFHLSLLPSPRYTSIYYCPMLPYVAFAYLKIKSSHSLMLAISLGFISLSKWAFAERCGKLPFLLAPESLEVFNSILFPYVFVPVFSPSLGIDLRQLVYWQVGIANWCRCRSGGDLSLHLIAVLSRMQHK